MKKILACLCIAGLLTACGGESDDDDTAAVAVALTPIEQGLKSGQVGALTDEMLLAAAMEEVGKLDAWQQQMLGQPSSDGALVYPVSPSSQYISPRVGEGSILLRGSNESKDFASATLVDGKRAAGIGFEFYQPAASSTGLDPLMVRVLTWLASDEPPAGIVMAGINSDALNNWLAAHFPDSLRYQCDGGLPVSCLEGADLLVVSDRPQAGDEQALEELVKAARQQNIGILYQHTRSWATTPLGQELVYLLSMSLGGYGGNYFSEDTLNWTSGADMLAAILSSQPFKTTLEHFYYDDFAVDWAACESDAGGNCDKQDDLHLALLDCVEDIKGALNQLDRQGRPLFDEQGARLLKILVLLGDYWRQQIEYPMTKESAAQSDFMRALFADYSVQYLRPQQPMQTDLGSFSDALVIRPDVTTVQHTIEVEGSHFTALGVYVLPGQRVRIVRSDASAATTSIRINTQRTGSTRLWDEYSRPRYLASPALPIAAGESLVFTTPYGGTLQLQYSSDTAADVSLRLENVSQHPFLQYGADMDELGFNQQLENSSLTWAEIRTPFAEIHSRRDRMNASINDSRYAGDIQQFLDDLFDYVLKDAYELAGFHGANTDLSGSVSQRCIDLNWDCTNATTHRLPSTLHINVDWFAHCGSGCSGNPYDQSWPLDPYGWGESHELGHNLQRARLKIYDGRSGEVSNNVFPLHKNWRLLRERNVDRDADRLDLQGAFNLLKQGASGDPYQVAYDGIWADDSYAANNGLRMAFYAQLPHLWAEIDGVSDNGWDIVTLLYLAERQFGELGDAQWADWKNRFGMSAYANKPTAINGNDFMLLVSSHLTGRDLRSLWDIWGIDYSADAATQLDSSLFPVQEKVIWVAPTSNDWGQFEKVVVASDMVWPFSP